MFECRSCGVLSISEGALTDGYCDNCYDDEELQKKGHEGEITTQEIQEWLKIDQEIKNINQKHQNFKQWEKSRDNVLNRGNRRRKRNGR